MQNILVPVDGSDGSIAAARFAARLARDAGASVTLFHSHDSTTADQLGMARMSREEFAQAQERIARGSFDRAREAMKGIDVAITEVPTIGPPAIEITAWAAQHRPDLIVMGSRGLSPLKTLLLGSISDHVLRHAPCPVTIVR